MQKESKSTELSPEYLTIALYIKRKHALMLASDPLAKAPNRGTIENAIKRGDIVPYRQGTMKFIDWNVYKDFVFRQYGEMPKLTNRS